MSEVDTVPIRRLVFWPVVLTTLVSLARLYAEVEGMATDQSGGGGVPLGISWLPPVFGAWFGFVMARRGERPKLRLAGLWFLGAFAVPVGTLLLLAWGKDFADASEAGQQAVRSIVTTTAIVAVIVAVVALRIWPRLGLALLVYGLCARVFVLILTFVAKVAGWSTHYTKLGPAGFEVDLAHTMLATGVAQLGLWVPYTILAGGFFGGLAAAMVSRR